MHAIVDFVRLMSSHGRVVTAEQAAALAGVELANDVPSQYQQLVTDPQYQDLVLHSVAERHYLYSTQTLADSYAKQCIAVDCRDPLQGMAAEVRRFSQLGELLPSSSFSVAPYRFDPEALADHCQLLCQLDDIERVTGNDGEQYLFSTAHIRPSYAQVLADYDPFEYSI
ncbi:hypothetical protein [Ferrimonas senticii]|uniref:hypothetical protein n=1 Tax=Ferrimonas senticii TaxID=394566 RepID=UPI00041B8257|nr:hypothetical protein [Ferrimonas senticii]